MKLQAIALMLLASLAAHSEARTAYPAGCLDLKTTAELNECRQQQIAAANSKLEKYLLAAKEQARQIDDRNAALIDDEQKLWLAYRDKHCGNVYDMWRMGSMRYEVSNVCMLEVTQERTVDVWRAYLTYQDSTPPVLPDPSP